MNTSSLDIRLKEIDALKIRLDHVSEASTRYKFFYYTERFLIFVMEDKKFKIYKYDKTR